MGCGALSVLQLTRRGKDKMKIEYGPSIFSNKDQFFTQRFIIHDNLSKALLESDSELKNEYIKTVFYECDMAFPDDFVKRL